MKAAVCAALAIGCGPSLDSGHDLGNAHGPRDSSVSKTRLRVRMGHHYDDLHAIERSLRRGRLDEARALAFWLTRTIRDPRVDAWPEELARLTAAARELSEAPTVVAAMQLEASVAAACGDCHARAGASAAFERDVVAPTDEGTPESRLRRHRWAADRVWNGVVGASPSQWRAGLEVFAVDISGYRVHRLATRALSSSEDRGSLYGELLVSCTTCHPSLR